MRYLRVEDKVLGGASVVAVVHRLGVLLAQGGVEYRDHGLVDGVVLAQRARDLELFDDHLKDERNCLSRAPSLRCSSISTETSSANWKLKPNCERL